jgi:hypothetical protein
MVDNASAPAPAAAISDEPSFPWWIAALAALAGLGVGVLAWRVTTKPDEEPA